MNSSAALLRRSCASSSVSRNADVRAVSSAPGGELVPDQDPRHRIVNSSIERQLRHHLHDSGSPTALTFEVGFEQTMINRGVLDSVRGTLDAIDALNLTAQAPPRAMVLEELAGGTDKAFVFIRGNPVQRGKPVESRFLSALSGGSARPFDDGQSRLGLAQAIVDPATSLTRRVIVNWVWQHHFGRGLVATPDDFGTHGEPPTHPGLLDFLAGEFLADGWSLKRLRRRIMLSAVYQQAALENAAARRTGAAVRKPPHRAPHRRRAAVALRVQAAWPERHSHQRPVSPTCPGVPTSWP